MDKNALPPSLVANLQQVLVPRNSSKEGGEAEEETARDEASSGAVEVDSEETDSKMPILVTNGDGIESPGLVRLVEGLVKDGRFGVYVCAPRFDRFASGHSLTVQDNIEVSSFEIDGATGFSVSGTPADCVSLALSEALFSSSRPILVISGVNRGPSYGQNLKNESSENDFKEAIDACLPLILAAARDIKKGVFPKSCLLNVELRPNPSTNKGFRVTRQSLWRSGLCWRAVSAYKHPSARSFMANQQSLGLQLAQLSRDASAASVEIESVGAAGKTSSKQIVRKHFCLEFSEKDHEGGGGVDEDLDFVALQNGFVTVTPIALSLDLQSQVQSSVSDWISTALSF